MTALSTMDLSARDWLRETTQGAHEAAEARWFAQGTFASRQTYERWLRALLSAHATYGARAIKGPDLADFAHTEHARCAALCADLNAAPVPAAHGAPKSAGWGWGVLYVLNGSALGASMVLKSGALGADWPRAYLEEMRGYATSGQLKGFFERLNAAPVPAADLAEGANAVFSFLSAEA